MWMYLHAQTRAHARRVTNVAHLPTLPRPLHSLPVTQVTLSLNCSLNPIGLLWTQVPFQTTPLEQTRQKGSYLGRDKIETLSMIRTVITLHTLRGGARRPNKPLFDASRGPA